MKRPVVIKAGGELLASQPIRKKIFRDLRAWSKKNPVVFIHGGGPQIEAELAKQKISNTFVNGRRVTSVEAMVVIEQVLSGSINKGIAGDLVALGVKAVGLSSRDAGTIIAKPIPQLGRAAKPVKLSVSLLSTLLKGGFLPVLSSVGADPKGRAVNINADDAASAIATALKARNLIFLTNIGGVLDGQKKRIPVLKITDIDRLISAGVITKGMIPKTQGARAAILKGVGEVDIVNGTKGVQLSSGTRIKK